jgi:hypothetical protein
MRFYTFIHSQNTDRPGLSSCRADSIPLIRLPVNVFADRGLRKKQVNLLSASQGVRMLDNFAVNRNRRKYGRHHLWCSMAGAFAVISARTGLQRKH